MAMTVIESTELFNHLGSRLDMAVSLARDWKAPLSVHYVDLLEQVVSALPQVRSTYEENLDQLQPVRLQSTDPAVLVRLQRDRKPQDLHIAIHELRRDFFDVIHPLEVLGKWPPDGFDSANPARREHIRARLRNIGPWPPKGF